VSDASAAVQQEAAYYQSIEEDFVARRGASLTISNADWTLIRRWRKASVPLRVVLRGIADAFEAHAHSWARARTVGSLRYCAAEVEHAHERWQRALDGGGSAADADDAAARVRGALEAAATRLGPPLGACAAGIVAAWAAQAPVGGPQLESWLRAREDELLREVRGALGTTLVAQASDEIEADLQPYRERLPERVLEQVREESQRRRLLELAGLPRLTLFEV
jgi:hypothetical protein